MALERMTRIIGTVMHSTKEYVCVMQLHRPVSEEKLRKVISEFEGEIYQRPPLRSSVKRALRTRRIYRIELIEYDGEKYALLRVDCDAGTYMRKLCWDIGLVLGVGAHMRELRRTRTGPFSEDSGLLARMQDLAEAIYRWKEEGSDDLLRRVIVPGELSVCHIPKVIVRDTAVESLAHGAQLAVPGVAAVEEGFSKGDMIAMLTLKGELVGLGRAEMGWEDMLSAKRGIAVKPTRILIERGVYPRAWKKKSEKRGGEGGGG